MEFVVWHFVFLILVSFVCVCVKTLSFVSLKAMNKSRQSFNASKVVIKKKLGKNCGRRKKTLDPQNTDNTAMGNVLFMKSQARAKVWFFHSMDWMFVPTPEYLSIYLSREFLLYYLLRLNAFSQRFLMMTRIIFFSSIFSIIHFPVATITAAATPKTDNIIHEIHGK